METILNEVEIRILGCLIEKEMTTPDYYPLTLNSLTTACNQKSNREPVVNFDETAVVVGLDSLRHKGLAMQAHGEGSRVPKYRHTLFEKLFLEPNQLALLCELLLRGPQTVGELRGRAERMHSFADLAAVETVLSELMEREPPLLCKLPRQPGRKEHRFAHLLAGQPAFADDEKLSAEPARLVVAASDERIARLEADVATLRDEVATLRRQMDAFKAQFE
jgi:hypothetical protein